jgi:hypothetical protein
MREVRYMKIVVGKFEGKRPFQSLRSRRDENIKMKYKL